MQSWEINFDGLVGPTHNYSGLSAGNLASMKHGKQHSNPREAALQGLKKMALLHSLGLRQAVLPPQERPSIPHLKRLGFSGSDAEILKKAHQLAPLLLNQCSSASCMWVANSGTTAPSTDSVDGKVHFTTANLVCKAHRSIEADSTAAAFRSIFKGPLFTHHSALPANDDWGDEGAANHTRLAPTHGAPGLHLFVYGRTVANPKAKAPKRFPARQTLEASQAVARLHGLTDSQTVFAQQNPQAIDAGVFHNDVISVGNENVFFFHSECFLNEKAVLSEIQTKWKALGDKPLTLIRVSNKDVPLKDAVKSYLFNTQLVSVPAGGMALIAPQECETTPSVRRYLKKLIQSGGPIRKVHYPELRQSMQNGGGPACLRFRVVLNETELAQTAPGVFIGDKKLAVLEMWVAKHYRDRLAATDLADPKLLVESRTALDELTQILGLGSLYPFQRS